MCLQNHSKMETVYKGIPVFYTDEGKGDVLVLLHGFLESSSMWESFIPILSKTHRVICIDILGHGKTACIGYVHTMKEMAAAVYAVLQDLCIDLITLIGHSMGGYVGCAFAKAYPEKTEGLCLLNASPLPDSLQRKLIRERANRMAKENYSQLVRMSYLNLFDAKTRNAFEREIAKGIKEALKTPVQGYIAGNSGMSLRENSTTLWKEGGFYSALLLGKDDPIIDSEAHKIQFEANSDYFEIIPGGHMSTIGQMETTLGHLRQILSRIQGRKV